MSISTSSGALNVVKRRRSSPPKPTTGHSSRPRPYIGRCSCPHRPHPPPRRPLPRALGPPVGSRRCGSAPTALPPSRSSRWSTCNPCPWSSRADVAWAQASRGPRTCPGNWCPSPCTSCLHLARLFSTRKGMKRAENVRFRLRLALL